MSAEPGVAELAWTTVTVPLEQPLRAGRLVIASREYCCVRARLADGEDGEAFVLTRGLDVAGALRELIAPWVLDRSVEGAGSDRLRVSLRNTGWDGPISRAAGAVSLAVLDARARARCLPVSRVIGADPGTPAPRVVVTVGYPPADREPDDPAVVDAELAEAAAAVAAGAGCVKLMAGARPDLEPARLRRVRAAIGPDCGLALDANGSWSLETAAQLLPALHELGLAFVEDPWPYELGMAGFGALGGGPRPALACGEVSSSVIELEALAGSGQVRYLRPDATLLGGPAAFARALPAAAAHGCVLLPHFWPEVHRHLVATYPGEAWVECAGAGSGGFGLDRFVDGTVEVRGGRAVGPDQPGFGYRLDWERIARLAGPPETRAAR